MNSAEDRTLWELSKAESVAPKTKERAQVLRLSSKGWKVDKIAEYMKCSKATVRRTIHRWKEKGLGGLSAKKSPGRKKKWEEEDLKKIEEKLEEERSYSSKQLCKILEKERKIKISERQMRRILKKKNISGREPENRYKTNRSRQKEQERELTWRC
ncbi:MAG: helix-turn-helix domain-containing protein [Spirulina sp.]